MSIHKLYFVVTENSCHYLQRSSKILHSSGPVHYREIHDLPFVYLVNKCTVKYLYKISNHFRLIFILSG